MSTQSHIFYILLMKHWIWRLCKNQVRFVKGKEGGHFTGKVQLKNIHVFKNILDQYWVEKSSNQKYGPKRLEFRLSSVLYKLASEDSITLVKLLPILTRLDRLSPDKLLRWFSSIWKKEGFFQIWFCKMNSNTSEFLLNYLAHSYCNSEMFLHLHHLLKSISAFPAQNTCYILPKIQCCFLP